jgi:hypothetical protein
MYGDRRGLVLIYRVLCIEVMEMLGVLAELEKCPSRVCNKVDLDIECIYVEIQRV